MFFAAKARSAGFVRHTRMVCILEPEPEDISGERAQRNQTPGCRTFVLFDCAAAKQDEPLSRFFLRRSRFILDMMDITREQPPTFEQALKEGDERRERELQDEPGTAEDELLDKLKLDKPEAPDYNNL